MVACLLFNLKHLCISPLDWFNSYISHDDKVLILVILQFLWVMNQVKLNCPGYSFLSQPYNRVPGCSRPWVLLEKTVLDSGSGSSQHSLLLLARGLLTSPL